MARTLQIRHVPDEVYRRLESRAARQGQSLSVYLRKELETLAAFPTEREMIDRLSRLAPVALSEATQDAVRRERNRRVTKSRNATR